RRQRATLSSSETPSGSISTAGRKLPDRASTGARARRPLPPAAAAKAQARSAASRAPSGERRRSQANPQAPPTRTPMPSVSASASVSTRPFLVPTACERRSTARASAYVAPAATAASTPAAHASRTAGTLVPGGSGRVPPTGFPDEAARIPRDGGRRARRVGRGRRGDRRPTNPGYNSARALVAELVDAQG